LNLNELLLAAQQHDTKSKEAQRYADIRDHIVLARTPENPLSPPDLFAATIATIQGGKYLRRISPIFDCIVLLLVGATAGAMRRVERFDLVLCGIAFTAAYCLVALGTMSRWNLWLPGVLPLGAIWISIFAAFFFPRRAESSRDVTITIPPPIA
jgi:hypothetical protein